MGKAANKKKARKSVTQTVAAKPSFWTSKRMVCIVLALISVLAIGTICAIKCGQMSTAGTFTDGNLTDSQRMTEIAKRKPLMDDVFEAAQKIVDKTKDEDAKAVLEFLRESAFLCAPYFHPDRPDNLASIVLESARKDARAVLGIVPLIEGDQNVSKAWAREYAAKTASAFFGEGPFPLIVVGSQTSMPEFWKGLIFLHEGHHALADAASVFDDIDDPYLKRALVESTAYEMETRLISKYYGTEYEKLLAEETRRVEDSYKKDGSIPMPDYENGNGSKMSQFLGPVQSRMDRGVRESLLWIHGVFRVMEKYHPEDPEKAKVDFLWTMYKEGHLK
jgi:hypothetical protein